MKLSKKMSYILRHNPEGEGIKLSEQGYTTLKALAAATGATTDDLEHVADIDSKQRFEVTGGQIRAAQGHSISVDLGLEVAEPPHVLMHGTVEDAIPGIKREGITSRSRQHVHLSATYGTATEVGSRRGNAIILVINSREMFSQGYEFMQSANGVWLTEHVPVEYIEF